MKKEGAGKEAPDNSFGPFGERIATEHLIAEGYAIRERNWHQGHYEIDIIAQQGSTIVFVEVKSRRGDYQDPLESVDRKKISRIVSAANVYMQMAELDFDTRFDIITLTGTPENYKLEHIEEAFFPPLISPRQKG